MAVNTREVNSLTSMCLRSRGQDLQILQREVGRNKAINIFALKKMLFIKAMRDYSQRPIEAIDFRNFEITFENLEFEKKKLLLNVITRKDFNLSDKIFFLWNEGVITEFLIQNFLTHDTTFFFQLIDFYANVNRIKENVLKVFSILKTLFYLNWLAFLIYDFVVLLMSVIGIPVLGKFAADLVTFLYFGMIVGLNAILALSMWRSDRL
ncbi:MAG: hypothetical protein A3F40_02795 [Chlamydiae bacterium RIFCSPHIGHO2_12_FULL_27_8]|nr:MAG: hypothetical protein A3F40_02795 [Chlamydiae bacterium RIFCSPHIGHO2_12_FULL_27_8]OGN65044.1 MAG: hypothetical protein A2888_03300 [Chlamydiae bacterium RIFCSPLOWO2_01_FULL_28_7]